ncbi:MAG: aminopeptidase P family protein [Bacteroidales bacterium]|nr:aminopeptidase P family protein [Bacteroidales bacterium]
MIASFTRVKKLREAMKKAGIDAYVMVNTDPHESEYIPDYWKCVTWLTGFKGEVATVIVTEDQALLWTDSRFFISGAQQLKGSPFSLMKLAMADSILPTEWIDANLGESKVIAGDLRVLFGNIAKKVNIDIDLISPIWTKRPALPKNKIEVYPEEYSGESTTARIDRIMNNVEAHGGKSLFLSALDDIAWTLNLRGSDIHCTPVFLAYANLSREGSKLFVNQDKVTEEVREAMKAANVIIEDYDSAEISTLKAESCDYNPIPLMKGIKNQVEIEGFRNAMLKDGIALTRFYHWLDNNLKGESEFVINTDGSFGISNEVTEMDCVNKLIEFRKEQPLYREESFDAIVAWNAHAALPHFETCNESNVPITGDGLLLIDTGGQYLDGTTDITRTIGIGNVSDAMKRDYTLVLKGHIRLASAVFPVGTRGDQLDALARIDLWRDGKTYRHGTSHGVGHYLGVHEGPESVRMEHNPQKIIEGMVFSNEPAIYLGDKYGIRHENCVLVRKFDVEKEAPKATPCDQTEHGEFFCLENLTICYFDTSCVVKEMLDCFELEWLNNYNKWVYDTLAPHLEEGDRSWLAEKTAKL